MNDHVTGSAEESSLQSFFGRLNYNYGGRYLLEMNVRHDGSSRMPKAHRYATFPSFSGAWIMTNEKFMENVKFLHSLKLRGSWGKLGNQEIGNYAYAATLAASGSYYFGDSKQIGMKTARYLMRTLNGKQLLLQTLVLMLLFGVERSMSLLTGMRKIPRIF